MYRPEIAYQKRTGNNREQNHLPRYPLPDWPTAWPTVEGAGICPHYPRSTPSHILLRHPTVEGDFVFGNPGRINAHTQKQSAERTAPSSSAQRFALAAGGRLFRRRCANRSALRTGWGKIAFGAQNGRCVTSENPHPAPHSTLWHIPNFLMCHIRRKIALSRRFPSSSVTSGDESAKSGG